MKNPGHFNKDLSVQCQLSNQIHNGVFAKTTVSSEVGQCVGVHLQSGCLEFQSTLF